MFEHKGVVRVPKSELKNNTDPLDLAIEVGAEDIIEQNEDEKDLQTEDTNTEDSEVEGKKEEEKEGTEATTVSDEEYIQLKCEPSELKAVSEAVESKGLSVMSASLEYLPTSYISLEKQAYENAVHLVELLNDHDDVVAVYDNFVLEKT